jgi:hypothetical protein
LPRFHIKSIYCNATDDDIGPDEIYITLDGKYIQRIGPLIMNINENLEIREFMDFNRRVIVKLWEEDLGRWPDYPDLLGTLYITSNDVSEGERSTSFTGLGWDYRITYEVLP